MTIPVTIPRGIAVQYESGPGVWTTLGEADLGSLLRTRRLAAPPGQSVTARKWRVVRVSEGDLTAMATLRRIEFRRETAEPSPVRRWSFDFDAGTQRYGLVATDGNLEVYQGSVRRAAVPSPYAAAAIPGVRRAQALDTLVAFLPSVPPWLVSRQGAHDEWDSRAAALTNVPLFDYDGTNAGGINEKQQLHFVSMSGGDTFNLYLEEEVTAAIAYDGNMTILGASVKAALEALPNVGAGGVTVTSPEFNKLQIEFTGPAGGADVGDMAPQVISSESGLVRQITLTQGRAGGEPVISASRGWPATGVFFQERLFMAGLASRPGVLLGSRAGSFFDFKTRGSTNARGIDVNIAADQSTRILALFPGPHLQGFTESAAYFCPQSPITPPPAFVRTTSNGMEPNTPLFEMGEGTVFVAGGGDTVSHLYYDEARQKYVAPALSVFWAHLCRGIVDAGHRPGRSTLQPDVALFVRDNGEAAFMSALLEQEVLGFTRWTTDGAFLAAGGELKGDLYVCVRRQVEIGGELVERHFYERLDEGHYLDASVRGTGPASSAGGLDHLEGRQVVLYLDGADAGDAVVENGAVTFPFEAERTWEVGLLFVVRGVTLPPLPQEDPRAGASKHERTGEIALRLGPTAGLRAGMKGKRLWPVKGKTRPGALLDEGPGENAAEGWRRVYPVPGFQEDSQTEFEQPRPGPLEIKELVVTVTA